MPLPVGTGDTFYGGMPKFDPGPWNDPAAILHNNCYNYALDRLDNVRRDPGALAGAPVLPPFYSIGWAVAQAAVDDGLQIVPSTSVLDTDDVWLVALVTAPPPVGTPYGDYHWYRRDKGGMWSHKSGFGSEATDVDDDDKPISDPAACARGQYIYFFGYFVVDRTRLKP